MLTLPCRLINTLKPGAVKKIHRVESGSFKQFRDMENIENFLKAIESYGVSVTDKFGTANLTDRNNGMTMVLNCIHSVGRSVSIFIHKCNSHCFDGDSVKLYSYQEWFKCQLKLNICLGETLHLRCYYHSKIMVITHTCLPLRYLLDWISTVQGGFTRSKL